MYNPAHFEEPDTRRLHALMRAHPLASWSTLHRDGQSLIVNHVPFMVDEARGELGTLLCHVARANPVWRDFSPAVPSVIAFQSAEHYISPSWYPSKREHGKVVPTWNYAVVHAQGIPQVHEDKAWLAAFLQRLTNTHEAALPMPWQMSDAPDDYLDKMLNAIVGIEIPITSLQGKLKLSQNRSEEDKRGVVAGLQQQGDAAALAMADMMR